MTDEAPERFRGLTVTEAQREVVAALDEQGLIARTEPYHHTVPFSQRSGAADRAADLAAVVHGDGRARQAGDRGGHQRPRHAFTRRTTRRSTSTGCSNIRPWCISRQLWWGHQLPVWYRDLETYVGETPPRGEGWTRDPDVLDTWFSSALWPFATLGWPRADPGAAGVLSRPTRSSPRATSSSLGGADDHDGARVHRHRAVLRRLRALGDPGARRPADVEVAGHRHRSARPDRRRPAAAGVRARARRVSRLRRRRACAGACWRCPRARTCASPRSKIAQGQQLATSSGTRRGWCCSAPIEHVLGAAAIPTAVEDRWMLSRLARAQAEVDAGSSSVRLLAGGAGAV